MSNLIEKCRSNVLPDSLLLVRCNLLRKKVKKSAKTIPKTFTLDFLYQVEKVGEVKKTTSQLCKHKKLI